MAQMPRHTPGVIQHGRKKRPALEFFDFTFGFEAAHLLIQRVEQLLPGSRARKGRAVIQGPAKSPEIQQSLRRAIEHHAHAIQQVNNRRRRLAHALHQRLIRQKIAAVDRVVEMLPRGIAFTLQIFRRVNAALRAHRMGALHRHDRKQLNGDAGFGHLDRRHQSSQPAAHDNNFRLPHWTYPPSGNAP